MNDSEVSIKKTKLKKRTEKIKKKKIMKYGIIFSKKKIV